MKRIVILIAIFCVATPANAQSEDFLYQQIEKAGAMITSMECELDNIYVKEDYVRNKHGRLYYQATDKIGAFFDNGDYAILNGKKMKIDIGIFHGIFRTDRGKITKPLSEMLFAALQGNCRQLADGYNYDIAIITTENSYDITFTTRKRKLFGIGYKQTIFSYGLDDKRIQAITLIDYKDNIDTYQLIDKQIDTDIDESKFNLN